MTLRYKLYLKTTPNLSYPLTENVGIHAIEYVDLFMGGTRIERVTGDWIYAYHKYHTSEKMFRNAVEVLSESNVSVRRLQWRLADEKCTSTYRFIFTKICQHLYSNL